MADRTDDYVAIITSEHRQQPNFQAAVRALTRGFAENTDLMMGMTAKFDIDYAVGHQLDIIGLWVGVTRRVPVPIAGVFFTWDDTVATGWEVGQWKGPHDPAAGIVSLPDSDFRVLIKAKIAANTWDGSAEEMRDILTLLLGANTVSFRDLFGTLKYRINYNTAKLSAVRQALLTNDLLAMKPSGVTVVYNGF